jgi:hypothetical protein
MDKQLMHEKPSYHQGTNVGFAVEARMQGTTPEQLAGQLFDNRWRRVEYVEVDPPFRGIPSTRHGMLRECGLYSHSAAQALRWWLHAQADVEFKGIGLETRLIQHKVTFKVEWQAEEAVDYEGTWEKRDSDSAPEQRLSTGESK